MNDRDKEQWEEAGRISAEAREYGLELIVPGANALNVVEETEQFIFDKGADLAFPATVAINNVAAHFTPKDNIIIEKGDIVTLDVGASLSGGYMGDTAATKEVGTSDNQMLINASMDAVEKGIELMSPGLNIGDFGRLITGVVESYGFNVIANLCGHNIEKNNLHAGKNILNVPTKTDHVINNGEVIAIEVFVTPGRGWVDEVSMSNIYRLTGRKGNIRGLEKKLYEFIEEQTAGRPFSHRIVTKHLGFKGLRILNNLLDASAVYTYPRFVADEIVVQTEHAMIVVENGCEVITKITV